MALVLKRLLTGYDWLFFEVADPRSTELNLILMSSPSKPFVVLSIYLYLVTSLGPRWMKNRQPFDLKKVIITFNIVQIVMNIFFLFESAVELFYHNHFSCAVVDQSYSPKAVRAIKSVHMFFLLKLSDLTDTIFFVLRKKKNQLSFLHIYHHFGMAAATWAATKFVPGGNTAWIGLINAPVHIIMYAYYTLTVWDSSWSKSIWFKKLITQLQLVQFLLYIIIYGRLLLITDCNYPKLVSYILVAQSAFMFCLFSEFYRNVYLNPSKHKKENS